MSVSILMCGCNGRMGKAIALAASQSDKYKIVAGVDIAACENGSFPVYTSFDDVKEKVDVIIDFSHHSSLPAICNFATKNGIPAVICTTGHTEDEYKIMRETAEKVGVFFSRNMSLGINVLMALARRAAAILGDDYDIEIVEKHHNKKLDAPSGTALMIADAVNAEFSGQKEYVYDRHSVRKEREKKEIGISSVRGGNIVGEHEIMFCGTNEIVTISHSAASREVFAQGAIKAALFMVGKSAGLYTMDDVLASV